LTVGSPLKFEVHVGRGRLHREVDDVARGVERHVRINPIHRCPRRVAIAAALIASQRREYDVEVGPHANKRFLAPQLFRKRQSIETGSDETLLR